MSDRLAAIADELLGERFGPGRMPAAKVPEPAAVIAQRRRILLGEQRSRASRALHRDRELTAAIKGWSP